MTSANRTRFTEPASRRISTRPRMPRRRWRGSSNSRRRPPPPRPHRLSRLKCSPAFARRCPEIATRDNILNRCEPHGRCMMEYKLAVAECEERRPLVSVIVPAYDSPDHEKLTSRIEEAFADRPERWEIV